MALAFQLRGERRCALSFFGDGATSVGDWHEAMNFAGAAPGAGDLRARAQRLRLLDAERAAVRRRPDRARERLRDRRASRSTATTSRRSSTRRAQARERALAGGGPTLIAAYTMRMHGHGAHDDASYVPAAELERWAARDPLERQRERLRELGVDVDAIEREVARGASTPRPREALAMAPPDPASALEGVFCEGRRRPLGERRRRPGAASRPADGAAPTSRRSPTRCASRCARTSACSLLGEDIGAFGGAFKVTAGLQEEFGAEPRDRHADLRGGDHRRRRRRRDRRHAPGLRDAVRRLRRVRLRPARQRRRQAALPPRARGADRRAPAERRRLRRRPVPLAESRRRGSCTRPG